MKFCIAIKIILLTITFSFCCQYYSNACVNNETGVLKSDTSWKYLGRPRPRMTPLRFPPDSLLATSNWMWHGSPMFSPDLKEMYWGKIINYSIYQRISLAFTKYVNNQWTSMQTAPFIDTSYMNNNPFFSRTGDTLFFISGAPGGFIFRVKRTPTGWTQPSAVPIPPAPQTIGNGLQFSIAKDGTLYFEAGDSVMYHDLYKSELINGTYQVPVNLGPVINTNYSSEICPYIDPDERFIMFASTRPGGYGYHDIYISKRNSNGTWSTPINLGATINSSFEDAYPYISPDGLYFFFTTWKQNDVGYNPYWISAQYIYNLISIGINNQTENVKDFELFQNYPNPFNPSTNIKFNLAKNSFVTLKIFDILGKEIVVLVNEKLQSGSYEIPFSINNSVSDRLSSGIFFYSIETENFKETKKMVYIK